MTTKDFGFFNRAEYFVQLAHLVRKTKRGDRVALASMPFNPAEPLVAELVRTLCDAAARGVQVHLAIDAITFMMRPATIIPGPLWYGTTLPEKLSEPFKSYLDNLQALKKSGGHYTITNIPDKPFSTPFAGRSHIKGAIVNNYIFIGGCNLEDAQDVDIMVGQTNKKAADWVYAWLVKMVATGSTRETFGLSDKQLRLDDSLQILIDAGLPKQSIIYDHAMRLIDSAQEHIFLTCQYFPGGTTGQHLLAAHKRGVDVRIVFAHPESHGPKALGHYLYNARERTRLPAEFFVERRSKKVPFLHAKVLATEKGSMVGSHNYVTQGVWLGTAEIALLSSDADFSKALVRKIGSEL